MKIFLILSFVVVVFALMKNVVGGRSYSTTRGVLKLSGLSNFEDLGKHTYRQLFAEFGKSEVVYWYSKAHRKEIGLKFLEGLNKESKRLGHKEWVAVDGIQSKYGKSDFVFVDDFSLFRVSRLESNDKNKIKKNKSLVFHIDELIHPQKLESFPKSCENKDRLFEFDCVQSTVSIKAAAKWERIESCIKVTVDQVELKDYLILTNQEDCIK